MERVESGGGPVTISSGYQTDVNSMHDQASHYCFGQENSFDQIDKLDTEKNEFRTDFERQSAENELEEISLNARNMCDRKSIKKEITLTEDNSINENCQHNPTGRRLFEELKLNLSECGIGQSCELGMLNESRRSSLKEMSEWIADRDRPQNFDAFLIDNRLVVIQNRLQFIANIKV